jgi:hypothetical protein
MCAMARQPGRIITVTTTVAIVLVGTAVAFFNGLIIHGRYDGAATLPAMVIDHHKPQLTVDFVAPDGQHCRTTLVPSDIAISLNAGDPTKVRARPPDYCADVQIDGDGANHALTNVTGLGLLTLAVIVLLGGLAWRQQAMFEAERPSDGPAPMVYQTSSMSNLPQLFAPFLVVPGLLAFTLATPGYPMLVSWGGSFIVVAFSVIRFWRSRRRLELQGHTLRWLGVLRRGQIAVADIRTVDKIDRKRRRGDTAIAVFTIADSPGPAGRGWSRSARARPHHRPYVEQLLDRGRFVPAVAAVVARCVGTSTDAAVAVPIVVRILDPPHWK